MSDEAGAPRAPSLRLFLVRPVGLAWLARLIVRSGRRGLGSRGWRRGLWRRRVLLGLRLSLGRLLCSLLRRELRGMGARLLLRRRLLGSPGPRRIDHLLTLGRLMLSGLLLRLRAGLLLRCGLLAGLGSRRIDCLLTLGGLLLSGLLLGLSTPLLLR
jgi:hypothetical protein